ncbi:DUF4259 domain-containing protein [Yinghuangia soli]|uniref:DUF4259 domain-containing protein n=1 Tax=Yinghuangia soli TaxID=2908204 RepID=A0AA41U445_9ACTN|nr:DUF4259 domain-containing protein [Yinghuangia soli]MCF2533398.1 DUF4259 domain-containing protein [Yinghuangia soli]
MGTWGSGNFDSDTAADHLSEITARLISEVAAAMDGDPVEIEPDEYWGVAVPCNLELLLLLSRQGYVGAGLPDPGVVADWKTKFMAVWEESIDGLEPAPGHKDARRAVLARTFDELAQACAAQVDDAS